MDITNSVMLITGASSGIGAATARAAAEAGARVVVVARREDRLRTVAEQSGGALAIPCDVTDAAAVARAAGRTVDEFGRIDIVVNCAGQGLQAGIEELDIADLRAVFELNVIAPLVVMQAVLPTMRAQRSGAIVNVSSGIVWSDLPGSAGYSASKAALEKLTRIARVELADAGIAVSVMFPSITETEFVSSVRGDVAAALALEAGSGLKPDTADHVAAAILDLVRSGAEQADLVPIEVGGSLRS
ncbi:SDR family oxidoreductase [Mycobacterium aquaticum]|uniref:Short-chain dehydrogenase n=1 Tax=Mycobacterium aquaticum TaxID=1927124 RepID=A0A1X0B0D4_9MYCO|nr:SDR family NAD(P)-dependent oxidoreductase [Mycobacterium aquaticum]ORA35659.1 short-chain dehydrogenase [Mycobacterium aquaticum]